MDEANQAVSEWMVEAADSAIKMKEAIEQLTTAIPRTLSMFNDEVMQELIQRVTGELIGRTIAFLDRRVSEHLNSAHIRRWDTAFPGGELRQSDGPITVQDGVHGHVTVYRNAKAALDRYRKLWSQWERFTDPDDLEVQEVLRWYRRHQFGPGFP